MVITSDAGQGLGVDGLLGHEGPPTPARVRVPVALVDHQADIPDVPSPLPLGSAAVWLKDGVWPEAAVPSSRSDEAVARWTDGGLVVVADGAARRFDPALDVPWADGEKLKKPPAWSK